MKFMVEDWNIKEMTGYEPISTFYTDFSIADGFGASAVIDTYKRAFDGWKHDYKMLTELVMVLNWKLWRFYEQDDELFELYNNLWNSADEYARRNLKGEELMYFYRTTD